MRHARSGDDQRDVDVGLERRLLAGGEPVLAHVQPVVGREDDVRVRELAAGGERRA